MKTLILATILTLCIGGLFYANAAITETLTLRVGQQKTSATGKIKVKFISVMEDSRCPVNVTCVWAGNAKIKISLAKGKKAARLFELNSTLKTDLIVFEGYEIRLVDLYPRPGKKVRRVALRPAATISITKIKH